MGTPAGEEECSKEVVFVFPLVNRWFCVPNLTFSGTLPDKRTHHFPRWIPAQSLWDHILASHIMGQCPLFLTLKESFLHMQTVSLFRDGKCMTSWSFT